jgi:hypothetical protein
MPNILDTLDVIQNLESIYENDVAFRVLKDFERVIDELGLYVYENWSQGELVEGPIIERHWVTCTFMWPRKNMPDPMGGKRLLDYDCKISYEKSSIIKAKKIEKPDDIRPGTKKGKLEKIPVWLVKIQMPKRLIITIYGGAVEEIELPELENQSAGASMPAPMAPPMGAPMGGMPVDGAVPGATGAVPPSPVGGGL